MNNEELLERIIEACRIADNDGIADSSDVNCNIHLPYFCGIKSCGAVTASSKQILKCKHAFYLCSVRISNSS